MSDDPPTGHVVLTGLMGSGKTTVGRLLAERLGIDFVDNDELLRRQVGRTAAELATEIGPDGLHELERQAAATALTSPQRSVVALAASTIDRDPTLALVGDGALVAYLRAPLALRLERMAASTDSDRPPVDSSTTVLATRRASGRDERYAAAADLVLDTAALDPPACVDAILAAMDDHR